MFDWDEARRIAAFAREKGIGTHLDGARLFIASAYTGISPAEYSAPFDTVYVSLWKYFNSGVGAILAGPKRVLDGMFHTRRMFGGNLAVGWPAALVARHYMDGFVDRLKSAVAVSEAFYTQIARHPKVSVERIPNGTNLTRVVGERCRSAGHQEAPERTGRVRCPTPRPAGCSRWASTRRGTGRRRGTLRAASATRSETTGQSRKFKLKNLENREPRSLEP